MGASMSTLGGWSIILSLAGYYFYRYVNEGRAREAAKAAAHRQRLEDRQSGKKDTKEKAKRQRVDAYTKDVEDPDNAVKAKPRAPKAPTPVSNALDYSSDDGVAASGDRDFARSITSVQRGTELRGPKSSEQKKQKSVKQSRAREIDTVEGSRVSAPSSTAGVDADDDESSIPSPEVTAADAGDISDMLEPKATGPSVLRLTDTDKVKPKPIKAKAPERVESKKQRQNRQKTEAAKALREETEQQRKVAMEAQRRLARISEGRAAQDGSGFMAKQSVWTGNGANGKSEGGLANGQHIPVLPLDTYESSPPHVPKISSSSEDKAGSWMSSLPSEEEQMEMLREEEQWNTVQTKKAGKGKKKETAEPQATPAESAVTVPQQVTPAVSQPVITKTQKPTNGNGKPAFGQQSSFAALSTSDEPEAEEEEEWDV